MRIPTKRRNYRKELNRNSGTEKYNNWIEKFTKGSNSRLEEATERISKLADTTFEIIEYEEQKEKTMKRSKQSLRDSESLLSCCLQDSLCLFLLAVYVSRYGSLWVYPLWSSLRFWICMSTYSLKFGKFASIIYSINSLPLSFYLFLGFP